MMMIVGILSFCCILVTILAQADHENVKRGRAERINRLMENIKKAHPLPLTLSLEKWSNVHNSSSHNVIVSCALSTTYIANDANHFVGSARKAGFAGDIVVVVLPGSNENFLKKLAEYNATVYTVPLQCTGKVPDIRCSYKSQTDMPITLIRYYIYQALALKYSEETFIMISDFRDVIFQTNPFKYKSSDWKPPHFQLTVFQESHPNRVINRCPQNGGFILSCYGRDALRRIGSNTISSSGTVFGTRNAIVIYTQLITQQIDPRVRQLDSNNNNTLSNSECYAFGVDQGFHNFILYTNQLSRFFDVKIFQQGEGPVNTVGGFYGEKKILKASLQEWTILRGEKPYKYVHNWNGELSPVVHQIDRFLMTELLGGFNSHLAVFQK